MADVDTTNWIPGTRYFTQITAENHSGWLYIITLLSLCYISIVFGIRFAVKFGMYGKDDWALLVSTFLAVCQHVSVLLGLGHGMGKSSKILSHGSIAEIEKVSSAAQASHTTSITDRSICSTRPLTFSCTLRRTVHQSCRVGF